MSVRATYIGRFAPSPTGPLHAGSLVAALASWLDARANGGRWLVRIEDVDVPRCIPGAAETILRQLATCGLHPDDAPAWQSQRGDLYQEALDTLTGRGLAYPCGCSRKDIEEALKALGRPHERNAELVYPGTCRTGVVRWNDRRLDAQQQDVERKVGDFVLKRADVLWAYQLAVVVDDALQGVTDIVRGEDLADNTPRQIMLQRALGLPAPRYLHTPLVLAANGEKLSKQNGAAPLDTDDPMRVLNDAATALGLKPQQGSTQQALAVWQAQWRDSYNLPRD
jgi:glutamyl-Q tRNA(Asp) synthetase